ncbi:hypothetical protein PTSG_01625 [Salpingoeca rosetta]|uniref:General transcription and DNA repair factor IIH subunit TFB5 n=1 Tax=Salpingoeca rosetta (strain ATCC 50818 / BSB-021) TaxID=946362 RepID=F2TYH3_SALR5|nr:uncharacterized protein PTSG_01625 [Salpingoeca rosetta]EGD78647.1 hypothetical protein PTSG_01625 [Salpingoeca rosetta]|eukprot:XP_004997605.1 hypothetical protein PTSG_01625 [Salpingoeca rosetta]
MAEEVHVERGIVLRCDMSIKTFVQALEARKIINNGNPFIIEDLGSFGLFVNRDCVEEIEGRVASMLDSNHFDDDATKKGKKKYG